MPHFPSVTIIQYFAKPPRWQIAARRRRRVRAGSRPGPRTGASDHCSPLPRRMRPPSPTIVKSPFPTAWTRNRVTGVGDATCRHTPSASRSRMVPSAPTATTRPAPSPATPKSGSDVGVATRCQPPFVQHSTTVPLLPTATNDSSDWPQRLQSSVVVGTDICCHPLAVCRTIRPPVPTTQYRSRSRPHTPSNCTLASIVSTAH